MTTFVEINSHTSLLPLDWCRRYSTSVVWELNSRANKRRALGLADSPFDLAQGRLRRLSPHLLRGFTPFGI